MALFPNSAAYLQEVPLGTEIQKEVLPELNVLAGETQAAWNARTRTITVTFDDGTLLGVRRTTSAIPFNATAATIQTAVEALTGVGAGNLKVAGAGREFIYSFSGTLANKAFKRMYHTRNSGGYVIKGYFEELQRGASQAVQTAMRDQLTREALGATQIEPTFEEKRPTNIGESARYANRNLIQVESFTSLNNGVAAGGTRTLTFNGQTTTALAWNATAATIQAALVALSNVAPGDITVTKYAGTYIYKFGGALTGVQPSIQGDYTLLTGLRGSIATSQQGSANRVIVEEV